MPNSYECLILLGGNQDDVLVAFEMAKRELKDHGMAITDSSSLYKTEPWGKHDQPWFYNMVLRIRTTLQPLAMLGLFKTIEANAGRHRSEKWGPRILDIDLLLYNSWVLETEEIKVPHPRMHERKFTLVPACEIAGDWIHPKLGQSLHTLLLNSADELEVTRMQS